MYGLPEYGSGARSVISFVAEPPKTASEPLASNAFTVSILASSPGKPARKAEVAGDDIEKYDFGHNLHHPVAHGSRECE